MTDQHPITPQPELVAKWASSMCGYYEAARWGADQELEECCDHMRDHQWGFVERPDGTKIHRAVYLQQSRRPKPPSLKEQALALLDDASDKLDAVHENTIRRALEALDD